MRNNLKEIRLSMGLTQEQLAEAMGTSKAYISQLENGTRNIHSIRQSTMEKLCAALNCSSSDLFVSAQFEYDEDGKLITDSILYDSRYPMGYIVYIEDTVFLLQSGKRYENGEEAANNMRVLPFYTKGTNCDAIQSYEYVLISCVPRKGFTVKLGRPITQEELDKIISKYKLTDDDISGRFQDVKGKIYGKYAKTYTCIQVRVKDGQAIGLEQELVAMGIEANNIAPGRVNIRVDLDE